MNQTRRSTTAAAALAMLLLSSACSGEPDDTPTAATFAPAPSTPEAEPSTAPSPAPSPGPTADALAAPELPAAATEETPEGAAAFAEWWFETLNYATATGDTDDSRGALQEECATCQGFAGRIRTAYESGGRIVGGLIDVQINPSAAVQEGIASTPVTATATAGEVLNADGSIATVLNAEQVNLVVAVAWTGSGWVIGDVVA